ncbi:MAG: tetratricopeptide repeat protein [Euryarchaeota archaeon]|nr:tetratricopeptide repeat protein [Euryarchaeota archaeon]
MIEQGRKHLIYEVRTTVTYELFSEMVNAGMPGLCFTTTAPQRLGKEYKLPEGTKIYLMSDCKNIKGTVPPKEMDGKMMGIIEHFLGKHKDSIVLIDDIEYLIMENGYEPVEKFISRLGKLGRDSNSTLLVPFNPNSVPDVIAKALARKFDDVKDVRNILVSGDKIECPECGAMWSPTTKSCDICGYDFEEPRPEKTPPPRAPGPKAAAKPTQAPPPKPVPKTGDTWFNRGVALEKMGKSDEAVECFDKALQENPNDAWAWFNKGTSLHRLGMMGEALRCYDKALSILPDDPDVLSNKGIALRSIGRTEEAIECYLSALKINPRDAGIWSNLGVTYRVLGRLKDALDSYTKALSINPNDVGIWLNKAAALQAEGKAEDALRCYEEVLHLDPRNAVALRNKKVVMNGAA